MHEHNYNIIMSVNEVYCKILILAHIYIMLMLHKISVGLPVQMNARTCVGVM